MLRGNRQVAITVVVVVVLALGAASLLHFYRTQTSWVDSAPYQRVGGEPARTLVAVYSRSGHTLSAAKEAARFFDADLLRIRAPRYPRTLAGQMRAASDANRLVTTTPIQHDPVDLSRYELIVLCSPVWWFRTAPPLWSFVQNHRLAGKPVLQLLTGISRLEEELNDGFVELVARRHGMFLETLFIRRGRMYWQKSPDEVNEQVREALEARKGMWPVRVE